jgi:tRNA(Arg) A34 adenosine deaminase TadA
VDELDLTRLRRAVEVAAEARARGNHPFGALLVDGDGAVLLEAENTVVTTGDPTGHAETNLVRRAAALFDREQLADCTIVASTEPCAMCAGAIYWAGIGRVVYALAEAELAAITGDHDDNPTMRLGCRVVFDAGRRAPQVDGPADLPEARSVHDGFWS